MDHKVERIFRDMSDRSIEMLHRNGKRNGARPFLKHPRIMQALRAEAEERGISVIGHGEVIYREAVIHEALRKMERMSNA